jgi:hypothetical protein
MNVTKLDIMFDSQHFKNKFPQFGLNIFRSSIIFVNIKLFFMDRHCRSIIYYCSFCMPSPVFVSRLPDSISDIWFFVVSNFLENLYPVQKEAKQNGQQTVLVHDQLFINSVLYQCDDNMDELHQANDTRNESCPAYRDALLTTTSVKKLTCHVVYHFSEKLTCHTVYHFYFKI